MNPRVRAAVGPIGEQPQREDRITRLRDSGEFSEATLHRVAELLARFGPVPGNAGALGREDADEGRGEKD